MPETASVEEAQVARPFRILRRPTSAAHKRPFTHFLTDIMVVPPVGVMRITADAGEVVKAALAAFQASTSRRRPLAHSHRDWYALRELLEQFGRGQLTTRLQLDRNL